MTFLDVLRLALFVVAPTLIAATLVHLPTWWGWLSDHRPDHHRHEAVPAGPPIERLAADLRRLLRLHTELTASAHLAMRAHRVWAVEAAITARAVEAARALDVPHRDPGPDGQLHHDELGVLLEALAGAGLVLPAKVGPFTAGGRL